MSIVLKLADLMKEKDVGVTELAEKIGISPVNLSNIKTGKISAIRFSTLDKICEVLGCEPGDLLKHELQEQEKKKIIPMFLDYSGTTDLLLKGGAENVKKFFNTIIDMQRKSDSEVRIIMVTGSSFESAKSKYKLLYELAENYDMPNLFDSVVAEYCGFVIRKDCFESLLTLDPNILVKRNEIQNIVKEYGGEISSSVTSFYNVVFENITRTNLAKFSEEIEKLMSTATGDNSIEAITYYDDYGKECDIKPVNHTKSLAVLVLTEQMKEKYNIPLVIIGGDSQVEDLRMYTQNKDTLASYGINSVFIAPSNIGEIKTSDDHIIIGDWENADGITSAVEKLTSRMAINEDGGLEI